MYSQLFRILIILITLQCDLSVNAKVDVNNTLQKLETRLADEMASHNVPGVGLAVLIGGEVVLTKGYGYSQAGKQQPITRETMFSVGSISKVVTAVLALQLVDSGKVKLDEDINIYLRRWQVPSIGYDVNKPVTLASILSHTAGLTVHGFADFLPGEKQPDIVAILNGTGAAKNQPVRRFQEVGSEFRYSGGGTTVAQLLVEDLHQSTLDEATQRNILQPLQMQRSSFLNPLPTRFEPIAKAQNRDGEPVALPRGYESMPEAGASGFWTSPGNFALILQDIYKAYNNQPAKLLTSDMVHKMVTPIAPSEFGLGPRIEYLGGAKIIKHGGANNSYRSMFRLNLNNGNGYVVFTNATDGDDLISALKPELLAFLDI